LKSEISDNERSRVQNNVEELRQAKEECYIVAMHCCDKLKNVVTSVGAFSAERIFIRGDPKGVIKWIKGEIEAFDEILTGRGIFVPA
jgi:energy-coupling factor transporter ATP-binding protein EcfA2